MPFLRENIKYLFLFLIAGFLVFTEFQTHQPSRIVRKTGVRAIGEAWGRRPANVKVMRKQRAVVFIEAIVPREVVGKIPIQAQWLAKNLVGDVARRKDDV